MISKTVLLIAALFAVGVSHAWAEHPSTRTPNVLFIVVDDLRPELGCYGVTGVKSPSIDRLAKRGMVFNHAYCQQAVCSPSRSSLLTGMRPDTIKVWDLETHFREAQPDVVTLLQNFKNHGYFVQGMGKIFHGQLDDEPSWSVPWQTPDALKYALKENRALDSRSFNKGKSHNRIQGVLTSTRGPAFECADVPDDTFQDGKVADLAIQTLRELNGRHEPFFLAVGFIKPHLPFVAPKKYWDLYDPATIELASNSFYPHGAPDYAIRQGTGVLRNYEGIPPESIPDDLARQLKHGYYAAVSYSDAQVGRLLDELDRLGLRDDTIIILWGDHGWKLGEHNAWAKQSNCENDTNAPLILSVPDMKHAGEHTDALVEFVDVYPTLSELAGLPLPDHLEGTSFAPLLDDPDRPWKSAAFSQYPRKPGGRLMGYSMRTARYRFTVWVNRNVNNKLLFIELYDHQTDPQENTNIAENNPELVERLMQQWKAGWQAAKPTK